LHILHSHADGTYDSQCDAYGDTDVTGYAYNNSCYNAHSHAYSNSERDTEAPPNTVPSPDAQAVTLPSLKRTNSASFLKRSRFFSFVGE
jgi:hypothetical protein